MDFSAGECKEMKVTHTRGLNQYRFHASSFSRKAIKATRQQSIIKRLPSNDSLSSPLAALL